MATKTTTPEGLTVERVPIASLTPHPDNPRNGDLEAIRESLESHGQYTPIVVANDGTVLVGNHRYAAALELDWTELDVVRLPLGPQAPEALRIMLADNRTSDLGRYDDALLVELLKAVSTEDPSLEGTGYRPDDLTDLVALLEYREFEPLDTGAGAYSTKVAQTDGVSADPGFVGRRDRYADKDTRSVILDYGLADYELVADWLARARTDMEVETNPEVLLELLRLRYG